MRFRWVKAPTSAELTQLTHTIAQRVGRFLERQGLLERDADDCRARIVPTMLLHFLRPWRSDGGGRAKQELEPRAKQEARAESNAGSSCRASPSSQRA